MLIRSGPGSVTLDRFGVRINIFDKVHFKGIFDIKWLISCQLEVKLQAGD